MQAFTDEQNKSDIQDKIRSLTDKVPQLQEVDLYQRKDDLITAANEALEAYVSASSDAALEGDVIETAPPADIDEPADKATDETTEGEENDEPTDEPTDEPEDDGEEGAKEEESSTSGRGNYLPYSPPSKNEFLL